MGGQPILALNITAFPTDNLDLNKEAGFNTASLEDDILDFTERNPFGEVDE